MIQVRNDMKFQAHLPAVSFLLFNCLLLLICSSCSNGVSESLRREDAVVPASASPTPDANSANQNKATKTEDVVKDCSFEYAAASGKEKINWPGTKKSECEAKCRSNRPQGVLGVCNFDNVPISAEFKSETSGGLPGASALPSTGGNASLLIPRTGCALIETGSTGASKLRTIMASTSQVCVEHCSTATLDSATKSATCYFDGLKISDVGSPNGNVTDSGSQVGSCKRNYVDAANIRVDETDQKSRAECASICTTLRQTVATLDCTFDGVPLLSVSTSSPPTSPTASPGQSCQISHKDQATGESVYTNETKPNYQECEASCESKLKPTSIVLKCQFGTTLPFLDVNLGDTFSDTASLSCSTESTIQGNSRISTVTVLGSECRKKCTDLWDAGATRLKCTARLQL
jgi:hypothetical protein